MNDGYILPIGFRTSGASCGIKKNNKLDAGLIYSDSFCICETFWTSNKLKAWHIFYDKTLQKNPIRAVFVNSGNANALNGTDGLKSILKITKRLSEHLNVPQKSILIASTGKISQKMQDEKILKKLPALTGAISSEDDKFPMAILTTDTKRKVHTGFVMIGGKRVTITGVAKGSGMISPNLATMLAFIMTDVNIHKKLLRFAAKEAVDRSFNKITVDGDMSPNDSVFVLANGMAGNREIKKTDADFRKISDSFNEIFYALACDVIRDAEGATKFIKINVNNAKNAMQAKIIAHAVANSLLVKTAFFGCSLNFGRIISAVGSTGQDVNVYNVDLKINGIAAFEKQKIINENQVSREMKKRDIILDINLKSGNAKDFILTNDISYDYVKINADYT
ncbi:MAG: bifunctional glutamate N-acetyltransferase/amino-acid acetyltransferase ArgJ [Candidatus Goldbacteria bacterium]|nr:bifunctional glutamate N-acetyltransferase/amino-acid acetyltransferase ArgJ [Candidatus Goldiibacteriota bacterium]